MGSGGGGQGGGEEGGEARTWKEETWEQWRRVEHRSREKGTHLVVCYRSSTQPPTLISLPLSLPAVTSACESECEAPSQRGCGCDFCCGYGPCAFLCDPRGPSPFHRRHCHRCHCHGCYRGCCCCCWDSETCGAASSQTASQRACRQRGNHKWQRSDTLLRRLERQLGSDTR